MKKKLNCFCILLLMLMIVSFVMGCLAGAEDFAKGWHEGASNHEPMGGYAALGFIVFLIGVLTWLYALGCFIRFILCVNHGEVFTWDNVALLRIYGWCGVFLPTIVVGVFTPELDTPLSTWSDCIGMVLDGVFVLIMAEAFAIGLKLKEEQELTI